MNKHSFDPWIAETCGLAEAVVLQQIGDFVFFSGTDPDDFKFEDSDVYEFVPYLQHWQVKRALFNLEEYGLLRNLNADDFEMFPCYMLSKKGIAWLTDALEAEV